MTKSFTKHTEQTIQVIDPWQGTHELQRMRDGTWMGEIATSDGPLRFWLPSRIARAWQRSLLDDHHKHGDAA